MKPENIEQTESSSFIGIFQEKWVRHMVKGKGKEKPKNPPTGNSGTRGAGSVGSTKKK